jgi:hypothetical protein
MRAGRRCVRRPKDLPGLFKALQLAPLFTECGDRANRAHKGREGGSPANMRRMVFLETGSANSVSL